MNDDPSTRTETSMQTETLEVPATTEATPTLRHDRFDRSEDAAVSETILEVALEVEQVTVRYGGQPAIRDVSLRIPKGEITALIGPSGCGKSTLLRAMNRMNDLIEGCTIDGHVIYHGEDIYADDVDPAEVRRRIGMVFQKPNPFIMSIYDNVAFGPRLHGLKADLDDRVESSLRAAALWDEVEDKLQTPGQALSGGQQQRLCIARAIAMEPDVILMDEPCSALDPIATLKIEDLMRELRGRYSIVIVTHNMQQAARVSDRTAFLTVDMDSDREDRCGQLVEFDRTEQLFTQAADTRTEAYITGRFG